MSHERTTRVLLVAVVLLLAGNLYALLRGAPHVAYAQAVPSPNTAKAYEIISVLALGPEEAERAMNNSAKRGLRYRETVITNDGRYVLLIMEKPNP